MLASFVGGEYLKSSIFDGSQGDDDDDESEQG
jgi:hypothetical protein